MTLKTNSKSVPVLFIKHDAMKTYWSSGGKARILDLGIRWRWV